MAKESKGWSFIGKVLTVLTILGTGLTLYKQFTEKGYLVTTTATTYPFKMPNEGINDTLKRLNKYTSFWYFVIENDGDKPLENLKLEVLMDGSYQLDLPDSSIVGTFKKSINIGNLNPSYSAVIYMWVSDSNATMDNFFESRFLDSKKENSRITHKYGYSKINFSSKTKAETEGWISIIMWGLGLMTSIIILILVRQKKMLSNEFRLVNMEIEQLKQEKEIIPILATLTAEQRKSNIKKLKLIISKNIFAPLADDQWPYQDTCLVHDYTIKNQYKIAIDTYCNTDGWEIQFFGRNRDSEEYLLNTIVHSDAFSSNPVSDYEMKGNRLIFKKFTSEEKLDIVALYLKDLLSKIEYYKEKNP